MDVLSLADFAFENLLHSNVFYSIYKCRVKNGLANNHVAVKIVYTTEAETLHGACMTALIGKNHKNSQLCNYVAHGTYNGLIWTAQEYFAFGDLATLLARRRRPCTKLESASMMWQILHCIKYVHEQLEMIHLDVQPRHFFIRSNGSLALADFAAAIHAADATDNLVNNCIKHVQLTPFCAPEILSLKTKLNASRNGSVMGAAAAAAAAATRSNGATATATATATAAAAAAKNDDNDDDASEDNEGVSEDSKSLESLRISYKSDIWSLGIVALQLANVHSPFDLLFPSAIARHLLLACSPSKNNHEDDVLLRNTKSLEPSLRGFIAPCLAPRPRRRPSLPALLANDFVAEILEAVAYNSTRLFCMNIADQVAAGSRLKSPAKTKLATRSQMASSSASSTSPDTDDLIDSFSSLVNALCSSLTGVPNRVLDPRLELDSSSLQDDDLLLLSRLDVQQRMATRRRKESKEAADAVVGVRQDNGTASDVRGDTTATTSNSNKVVNVCVPLPHRLMLANTSLPPQSVLVLTRLRQLAAPSAKFGYFTGSQLVEWLMRSLQIARDDAIDIGNGLFRRELIFPLSWRTKCFLDTRRYYRMRGPNDDSHAILTTSTALRLMQMATDDFVGVPLTTATCDDNGLTFSACFSGEELLQWLRKHAERESMMFGVNGDGAIVIAQWLLNLAYIVPVCLWRAQDASNSAANSGSTDAMDGGVRMNATMSTVGSSSQRKRSDSPLASLTFNASYVYRFLSLEEDVDVYKLLMEHIRVYHRPITFREQWHWRTAGAMFDSHSSSLLLVSNVPTDALITLFWRRDRIHATDIVRGLYRSPSMVTEPDFDILSKLIMEQLSDTRTFSLGKESMSNVSVQASIALTHLLTAEEADVVSQCGHSGVYYAPLSTIRATFCRRNLRLARTGVFAKLIHLISRNLVPLPRELRPSAVRVGELLHASESSLLHAAFIQGSSSMVTIKYRVDFDASHLDMMRAFRREVAALGILQHPHIVRYIGFTADISTSMCGIVTEHMTFGSVASVLFNNVDVALVTRLRWARDVADALAYVHACGLVHSRVSIYNVLLNDDIIVKLADFGDAFVVDRRVTSSSSRRKDKVAEQFWRVSTPMDPAFTAPELMMTKSAALPTFESDVYGLGVVAWCFMSQKAPQFRRATMDELTSEEMSEFIAATVDRHQRQSISSRWGSRIGQLLRRCWEANALMRPKSREVHSIFAEQFAERCYGHHMNDVQYESSDMNQSRSRADDGKEKGGGGGGGIRRSGGGGVRGTESSSPLASANQLASSASDVSSSDAAVSSATGTENISVRQRSRSLDEHMRDQANEMRQEEKKKAAAGDSINPRRRSSADKDEQRHRFGAAAVDLAHIINDPGLPDSSPYRNRRTKATELREVGSMDDDGKVTPSSLSRSDEAERPTASPVRDVSPSMRVPKHSRGSGNRRPPSGGGSSAGGTSPSREDRYGPASPPVRPSSAPLSNANSALLKHQFSSSPPRKDKADNRKKSDKEKERTKKKRLPKYLSGSDNASPRTNAQGNSITVTSPRPSGRLEGRGDDSGKSSNSIRSDAGVDAEELERRQSTPSSTTATTTTTTTTTALAGATATITSDPHDATATSTVGGGGGGGGGGGIRSASDPARIVTRDRRRQAYEINLATVDNSQRVFLSDEIPFTSTDEIPEAVLLEFWSFFALKARIREPGELISLLVLHEVSLNDLAQLSVEGFDRLTVFKVGAQERLRRLAADLLERESHRNSQ